MSIATVIKKTTKEFDKWVGYTEKNNAGALAGRSYENPGKYTEHAGRNNYTVFADLYKKKTGINVQGMAWCDSFTDTVFIHLFGVENARKMLNGFSAYTPTSASFFKAANAWYKTPQEGDLIFFKNDIRIYHIGYVTGVDKTYVYTVEGNTGGGNNTVVENGGQVARKKYLLTNPRIAGYGRPNWAVVADSIVEKENVITYQEGWMKAADNIRWWYQFKDGKYAKNDGTNNGWYKINDRWYLFDKDGYMLTGYQVVNGKGYYLSTNSDTEGAMMKTREDGSLYV